MFLHKPVEQDDGVVNGQRQLQHRRHSVGHKGDLAKPEVGPRIQHNGYNKCHHENDDLHIGTGGKEKNQQDNDSSHSQDSLHILFQGRIVILIHGCVEIHLVILQLLPYTGNGPLGQIRVLFLLKGQTIESAGILIIVSQLLIIVGSVLIPPVVKSDRGYAADLLQGPGLLQSLLICNAGHQHLGRTKGGKLLVHNIQPLPGLRGIRQIIRQLCVDLSPVQGGQTVDTRDGEQHHKGIPLVHHKGCKLHHEIVAVYFRFHTAFCFVPFQSTYFLFTYSISFV